MNSDFGAGTGAGGGGLKAKCAAHPDNLAGGTCTRCGNFICYVDTEGGRFTTCVSCRNRTTDASFTMTRQQYSFSALWDYSWNLFKTHWLILSAGVLILFVTSFVLSFVLRIVTVPLALLGGKAGAAIAIPISLVTSILIQFVVGLVGVGLYRMIQDVQEGRSPDIGRMFSQFSKAGQLAIASVIIGGSMFAVTFVVTMITGVGIAGLSSGGFGETGSSAAMAAVPLLIGLYLAVFIAGMPFFMFMLPEIALTDVGAMEVLKNCWTIARGYRLEMFLVGLVSVPIMFAGMLACCVGFLPALSLVMILFTTMHRALRNGAEGVIGEARA